MFIFSPLIAQTPAPIEIVRPQAIRPLPGSLDQVPVFNSNSPEKVGQEGILLSTFPPQGMSHPEAHLNFEFKGRFDLFAHHIFQATDPNDSRSLYIAVLVYNPQTKPVTIDILEAASYLSQPDAPFINLDPLVENPDGTVYAGPGSRVTDDILRGKHSNLFPKQVTIAPKSYGLLMNLPIPVRSLAGFLNGRSTYLKLYSDGPIYAASLALKSTLNGDGSEQPPTLEQWQNLLTTGELSSPRDRTPTPPNGKGNLIYGRVAGVSKGSQWKTQIYDTPTWDLAIPPRDQAFSYGISTLAGGTYGTGQIQTAPMLVRYPDTAYAAHGNYGVKYDLTFPLINNTTETQSVILALETPLKQDNQPDKLRFLDPVSTSTFYRGTVMVDYKNDRGFPQHQYFHLVQKRGQQGQPLLTITMPPGDRRLINLQLLYPPDATPPQVITIQSKAPISTVSQP